MSYDAASPVPSTGAGHNNESMAEAVQEEDEEDIAEAAEEDAVDAAIDAAVVAQNPTAPSNVDHHEHDSVTVGTSGVSLTAAVMAAEEAAEEVEEAFRPRVLVVDDSAMNRRMLCRSLELAGFDTVQADDGLTACAAVSHVDVVRRIGDSKHGTIDHPDAPVAGEDAAPRPALDPFVAILMDSNMPIMSGPNACLEIRQMGYRYPIFGVTGDAEVEDFIRAGADGVMLKPVKMDDLLQRLQKAIRKALEGKGARKPLQPVSSTIMAAMGTSGKHHAKGTTDKDFERRLAEWYRKKFEAAEDGKLPPLAML